MSADKISEYSDRIISAGNEKLLPTAAIFGANASGKSNVIEAMKFMVTYVLNSFGYGGDALYSRGNKAIRTPFLFDRESKTEPSSFEIYFIMPSDPNEKTYNYGFSIGVMESKRNGFIQKQKHQTHIKKYFTEKKES